MIMIMTATLIFYFVNSLTVDLVKSGGKTKSDLYHNNGDGTFTDVTQKAGVGDTHAPADVADASFFV